MNVSIIGTGYVGTVTGACFAELGHNVVCVDIDSEKVRQMNEGIPPIHEEGLPELLKKHVGSGLRATSDYSDAISDSDATFICVGTPSDENGSIDLSIVRSASESIGRALAEREIGGTRTDTTSLSSRVRSFPEQRTRWLRRLYGRRAETQAPLGLR